MENIEAFWLNIILIFVIIVLNIITFKITFIAVKTGEFEELNPIQKYLLRKPKLNILIFFIILINFFISNLMSFHIQSSFCLYLIYVVLIIFTLISVIDLLIGLFQLIHFKITNLVTGVDTN